MGIQSAQCIEYMDIPLDPFIDHTIGIQLVYYIAYTMGHQVDQYIENITGIHLDNNVRHNKDIQRIKGYPRRSTLLHCAEDRVGRRRVDDARVIAHEDPQKIEKQKFQQYESEVSAAAAARVEDAR